MSDRQSAARPPRSARRRRLLVGGTVAAAGLAGGALLWSEEGLRNACHAALPPELERDPIIRDSWKGLDPAEVWDMHVHLVGLGDSASGIHVSPRMREPANPLLYAQFLFYLNAGCVHDAPGRVDETYVARLQNLVAGMQPGFKIMLFAFDGIVDAGGADRLDDSMLAVPDDYVARVARSHAADFEWVASIHPYRSDAVERLDRAVAAGARAVKWLPNAMLIDPASPACDRFYSALARHRLPLITHAGHEAAVHSESGQAYGNPLRLRRALDHGVRVVVAHCASLGQDRDIDRGPNGPVMPSFDLFARLMDEPRNEGRLFGDISAITQRNRAGVAIARLLERPEWHARLLNGSDYPLPGIVPLVAVGGLADAGLIASAAVPVLRHLREHNPLLFDFVLKRELVWQDRRFPARVFETRRFFDPIDGRSARAPA